MIAARFSFRPGLRSNPFANVRLEGSWDDAGCFAADWSVWPMAPVVDTDGCPAFEVEVVFDGGAVGTAFSWGVRLDGPAGRDVWAIAREVDDENSSARVKNFVLAADMPPQVNYLTHCARLGAVKQPGSGIRFAVWAPNARAVDLVLADSARGYVADDGTGVLKTIKMNNGDDGVWRAGPADDAALGGFAAMVGTPYMFHITKDDGSLAFRTDMYSRMQIGQGDYNPNGQAYAGPAAALDGPPSCSVVCDADIVAIDAQNAVPEEDFWRDEFLGGQALPAALGDLVIYELHVGAVGFGKPGPGTLDDAMALLDHLTGLGINAVELMPIAEFEDKANWGYGTAQYFAIDQAAGGTDRLKMFVKLCHQRGIAVILDVCYNHFDPAGERVQWAYDSNDPARNIYFWYEGVPADYASPDGGYIDNLSTGYAPAYAEEMVRQVFISSAAWLVTECHVDGFRLDQTSSIHQYAVIHANGEPAGRARVFGIKFLRQWTRTMRLLKPGLFLSAEDYSGWAAMTAPSLDGDGLGFDATWYGDFQHHLVESGGFAELVAQAGFGDDRALNMDYFAGALGASGSGKVVYNESHDDCGNRAGSARTIWLAVNGAALVGETRRWAEARVRFAAAMALLSAGTPMFFMGEEIGAAKFFCYDTFLQNRRDVPTPTIRALPYTQSRIRPVQWPVAVTRSGG
jgi:1,4-alpha-glucan branching enzyme